MTITTRLNEESRRLYVAIDGHEVAFIKIPLLERLERVEREEGFGPRDLYCGEIG